MRGFPVQAKSYMVIYVKFPENKFHVTLVTWLLKVIYHHQVFIL